MNQVSMFLSIFLIVSLVLTGGVQIPHVKAQGGGSFGETGTGSSSAFFDNHIALEGSWTISEDGTGVSMSAVVTCTIASHDFAMAVYNTSLYIIGYTDETAVSVGAEQTITLDFASGHVPTFEADTAYLFALWTNNPDGNLEYHYEATGGTHRWNAYTYDYPNWEDPHTPDGSNNRLVTIWCNYTTGVQEYLEEFTENIGVSASLSRWREQIFFFTETVVITESSSFTKELLFEVIEFTELIQFDADLYLTLPTIPVEDEVSTFGTIALVIAIIALAIGIVAFTRRS